MGPWTRRSSRLLVALGFWFLTLLARPNKLPLKPWFQCFPGRSWQSSQGSLPLEKVTGSRDTMSWECEAAQAPRRAAQPPLLMDPGLQGPHWTPETRLSLVLWIKPKWTHALGVFFFSCIGVISKWGLVFCRDWHFTLLKYLSPAEKSHCLLS